jgi:hypothetical protein
VDIDQARGDVEPGHVHRLRGFRRGDVWGDLRHLASLDADIHDAIDRVFGVDDVTSFEKEVVLGLRCEAGGKEESGR